MWVRRPHVLAAHPQSLGFSPKCPQAPQAFFTLRIPPTKLALAPLSRRGSQPG